MAAMLGLSVPAAVAARVAGARALRPTLAFAPPAAALDWAVLASYAVAMFAQVLWAHRKICEKLTAARKAADAPPETSEKLLDEPEADEPDSVGAALSKMYGALVPGAGKAEC